MLSKTLRHTPNLRRDGLIEVDELLRSKQYEEVRWNDIILCTNYNSKNRFELKRENGRLYIRARQGHSQHSGVDPNAVTHSLQDGPDIGIHGTPTRNVKQIIQEGLDAMGRQHIHMRASFADASGGYTKRNAYILVDIAKAIEDGMEFRRSSNDVILGPLWLNPEYIIGAVNGTGEILHRRSDADSAVLSSYASEVNASW